MDHLKVVDIGLHIPENTQRMRQNYFNYIKILNNPACNDKFPFAARFPEAAISK